MSPLQWLDIHASAMQAIVAVLGLAGLIWYCILTRGIYKASLRQASAAIRPFIVIDELTDRDHPNFTLNLLPVSKKTIYIIRNLGNGPAMDIRWARGATAGEQPDTRWMGLGDLAVDDWSHITDDQEVSHLMFEGPEEGLTFRFCDSAGTEYESIEEKRNGVFYQCSRIRNRKGGL